MSGCWSNFGARDSETRRRRAFTIATFVVACGLAPALAHAYPVEAPAPSRDPIVNGDLCDEDQFPGALFILAKSNEAVAFSTIPGFCTATLIAPDVALTATHCLTPSAQQFGTRLQSFDLFVTAETDNNAYTIGDAVDLPADAVRVRSIRTPLSPATAVAGLADFDDVLLVNQDIALLFLDTPLFDRPMSRLAPDELVGSGLVPGATVEIGGYGWATATPNSQRGGVKRCASTTVLAVGPFEFLAGESGDGARKCFGDSGGPTYLRDPVTAELFQVGVASRGLPGEAAFRCDGPIIDVRVDVWRTWIETQMAEACVSGDRLGCWKLGETAPPQPGQPAPDEGRPLDSEVDTETGCQASGSGPFVWVALSTGLVYWTVIRRRPMRRSSRGP